MRFALPPQKLALMRLSESQKKTLIQTEQFIAPL